MEGTAPRSLVEPTGLGDRQVRVEEGPGADRRFHGLDARQTASHQFLGAQAPGANGLDRVPGGELVRTVVVACGFLCHPRGSTAGGSSPPVPRSSTDRPGGTTPIAKTGRRFAGGQADPVFMDFDLLGNPD